MRTGLCPRPATRASEAGLVVSACLEPLPFGACLHHHGEVMSSRAI